MNKREAPIRWAPKVKPERIRLLYETDASRVMDEELVDEVGYALLARCQSILEVTEAVKGRAKCHGCDGIIEHRAAGDFLLICSNCGWTVTWKVYQKSYQEKQLFGGAATELFRDYFQRFLAATTAGKKLLLIDRLLHEFHWYQTKQEEAPHPARSTAANLIAGRNLREVIAFLDQLTYGEGVPLEAHQNRERWRRDAGRKGEPG